MFDSRGVVLEKHKFEYWPEHPGNRVRVPSNKLLSS